MKTERLISWSGPALVAGGLLWITHYAIWIVVGALTGEVPAWGTASAQAAVGAVGYLDLASFSGAMLFFAAGLLGLGAMMEGRSKALRAVGIFFAALAGLMAAGGLVGQVLGLAALSGMLMGNGVIGSLLGVTFLSVAALRTRALPRATALLLLANGLFTFPLIVGIISVLPDLPSYAVDELPFAVSGAAWVAVGLAVYRGSRTGSAKPVLS